MINSQQIKMWQNTAHKLDVNALIEISGGEVVVSSKDAAEIGKEAGANLKGIVEGWNDLWGNFDNSYLKHRN